MDKIKVSIVSYLNSKPFLYGLNNSAIKDQIELSIDTPSLCAQKLITNQVDLGLVPVVVLKKMTSFNIISDYCIGSEGKVDSVMLYSKVPLSKIKNILLDYQSNTSVALVKVLAKFYWKIDPNWVEAQVNYENNIVNDTAALIIGDRTFSLNNKYSYSYDLSEEWYKFTSLPFVFACWISNKSLSETFIRNFNRALKIGLDNRFTLIAELNKNNMNKIDLKDYLFSKIRYDYDSAKETALKLFLSYLEKLD